jgi:pimeloyl-ACP methyl ester carboxylesterase
MAAEERTKDLFSAAELPVATVAGLNPAVSRRITVPALTAAGELDSVFCGPLSADCSSAVALHTAEAAGYSSELTTYVQPGAGHSLALARDGGQAATFTQAWLAGVLAADDGTR